MKHGCIRRRFVGICGAMAVLLALSGCGRDRVNPIDPNFSGSQSLSPPTNIKATGDINLITLTWTGVNSTDLAGYGIWRSTSATGGYVRLRGESADTSVTTARTTFIDTTLDLSKSKIYFYKINTVDVVGRSSALSTFVSAEAQDDTRPPGAPTNLSAVTDVNTGKVTLAWTAPQADAGNQPLTGLADYKIFRSKNSQTAFVQIATVPAGTTSYVDKDQLEVNAQYYYQISAQDATGNEGARSSAAALTTAGTGVAAPTGLKATGGIGEITVTWNAVSDPHLLGYLLLRASATSGPFTPVTSDTLFTTGQTTYTDQAVVADQVYYYRVQTVVQDPDRGLVRSDASPFTDGKSSADQKAPAAPSDLIASLDDTNFHRVQLSWTAPTHDSDGGDLTGLATYRIYRSRQTASSYALLATVSATQVTYQDTSVDYLTQYYYTVSAVDSVGNVGPRSTSASVTTKGLAAPRTLTATAGVQKITLAWAANTEPELTGYEVLRFTDPSQTTPNATFNSVLTTYVDTPVVAGQTFVYRIRAVGTNGLQSELSNFASAQAVAPTPILATPRNVQATGGLGLITISWAANTESELTGYQVLRYADPSQTTPQKTFSTFLTTYVDSPLAAGQTYVYRVQAVGTGGLQSDLSLYASATTQVFVDTFAPATPGSFAGVLNGSTTINLQWKAPTTDSNGGNLTGLSSFVIYRAVGTSNAGLTVLATVDSTRRAFSDIGLEYGTTYLYQISAVDAKGNESPRSTLLTLTTPAQSAVVALPPTNLQVNYAGNVLPIAVQLTWTPPAEYDSFLIQRAVLAAGASTNTLSDASFTTLQSAQLGTSYDDTTIQSGTTYVYRVKTNRSGQISDSSTLVTIIVP